jgi:choline dehydrogenase-like flavoprotein
MILDLLSEHEKSQRSADVCIIGAGAAGITIAVELSRLGLAVLLLEGGGFQFENSSQQIYESEIVGLPHRGIHDGRFRVLGGTTSVWPGQIMELDDMDFRCRPWVPESGWPISKETLRRYYERALEIESLSQCLASDKDVRARLHVQPLSLGGGLDTFFTRWCPRPNFAKLFEKSLEKQSGLTAYVHANACEFVFSDSGEAITAVRCKTIEGREFQFAAKTFVLCLGGIETPRLLLQPLKNGGPPPWNRTDNVGRYFQDHICVSAARVVPANPEQFHLWFDTVYLDGLRYLPRLKLSARLQEQLGLLAVGASFASQSARQATVRSFREVVHGLSNGEYKRSTSQLCAAMRAPDILIRKAWRYYRHNRAYNPDDLGINLSVICEQAPNPNSRLTLAKERDVLGLFKSTLDWRFGELELNTIGKFLEYTARQFEVGGIAKTQIELEGPQYLEGQISKGADFNHHMGATRMATSAQRGVVDENCKVFGVDNLFVCSSAVFPSSGLANPTHTIIALGIRLAEHISQGHSHRQPRVDSRRAAGPRSIPYETV